MIFQKICCGPLGFFSCNEKPILRRYPVSCKSDVCGIGERLSCFLPLYRYLIPTPFRLLWADEGEQISPWANILELLLFDYLRRTKSNLLVLWINQPITKICRRPPPSRRTNNCRLHTAQVAMTNKSSLTHSLEYKPQESHRIYPYKINWIPEDVYCKSKT